MKRRAVKRRKRPEPDFGVMYWAWRFNSLQVVKGRNFSCFLAFYMGCDGVTWQAAFNGLQIGIDPSTKVQLPAFAIVGTGATPQIALQDCLEHIQLTERADMGYEPPRQRFSGFGGL